jgi:hypothetical protein
LLLLESEGFANTSLDAVTFYCSRSVFARNEHPEPRLSGSAASDKKGIALENTPFALAQQPLEFGLLPQPACRVQDETLLRCRYNDYNPRRRRPRARRLRNTLRPPRVLERTRNP